MATDRELVKRVQNGENQAYTELFRKYYQDIYAICISMVKNPQDAEELAQEMFVLAYLKLDQLRNPAKFLPWLKRIARNRSRNFLQRREADVIPLSPVDMGRSSVNPDEDVLRQELIQAIMDGIGTLPDKDRQLVKARIDGLSLYSTPINTGFRASFVPKKATFQTKVGFVKCVNLAFIRFNRIRRGVEYRLSYAEISERFGMSHRAALSRLYRARKKLADHLKGLYSILGLAKILRPKTIISGGTVAMKIGTGAKVTIGVISVLVVGFVVFQIATRQPDQEVLPPRQTMQETSVKSPRIAVTGQQEPGEKGIQTQIENITASPDSPKEAMTEVEAEEFLTFLDQLDSEKVVDPQVGSQDEGFIRRFGMTRAEIVARIPILEEEIKIEMLRLSSIANELMDITQSGQEIDDETDKWCAEADKEVKRAWLDLTRGKVHLYTQYRLQVDREGIWVDRAPGGWFYEMQKTIPMPVRPTTLSPIFRGSD